MSYIGNLPSSAAFVTDSFSGTGSTTAFTMSVAPANTSSVLVAISGVLQDPAAYSVSGTTLTFTSAPPSGTGNISVRYLGIPASGVTTTAYRTVTEFTATAGQTTFSPPSYTVGYINVYRNGVRLSPSDYTASNGTTVVLGLAASAGDTVVTESFYVSSVLNALTTTGGTINAPAGSTPLIVQANGTTGLSVDSAGGVTAGVQLAVSNSSTNSTYLTLNNSATNGRSWAIYSSGGGPATAGTFGIYDNGAGGGNRLQITSAGVVNLPLGQLSFPASQNASSDANTLDDYEEGTWTPSISYNSGGSTGVTYTSDRLGWYTKVGNIVHLQAIIGLTNKGSGTGLAFVIGLPFTTPSTYMYTGSAVGYTANFSTAAPNTVYLDPNNTRGVVYNTGYGYINDTNFTNSAIFCFQCTYRVA